MKKSSPSSVSMVTASPLASSRPAPVAGPTRAQEYRDNNDQALSNEQILQALTALKKGDFSVRLPITLTGTAGRVADAFNDVAEMLGSTTDDLSRVCRVAGKEGKITERLVTGNVSGGWAERVSSVNTL